MNMSVKLSNKTSKCAVIDSALVKGQNSYHPNHIQLPLMRVTKGGGGTNYFPIPILTQIPFFVVK